MRNRLIAGITLASFLSATGLPALALGGGGNVESSTGQVLVRSEDGWQALQGRNIPLGTMIRTGDDGQATLRVGGNLLRVAPNSEFCVVAAADGAAEVALGRGRVLGRVDENLVVSTERSTTRASRGEFLVETSAKGSALRVLSGDARLQAKPGGEVAFGGVPAVAAEDANILSSVAGLGKVSAVGDIALLGEWRMKGKGVRIRNTTETVGGEEDASPDQDVPQPRPPRPPVVDNTPPTPPPTPPTPPTPPPTPPTPPSPPPAPAVGAGGVGAGWIIGGLALIGGVIAIAANDNDNSNRFVAANNGNPSSAQP